MKEQVNLYNQHCLEKLSTTTTIYEFSADHSILESSKQAVALIPPDDNNCAGLARTVKLAVGAQVMLRRNIMCENGLENGAQGVVVKFTWPNGESDQPETGALPQNVLIKFHDPRVGRINCVYLNEPKSMTAASRDRPWTLCIVDTE